MPISYKKLWKMLIDRSMSKTDLRNMTGISQATIAKLSNEENINTDILDRICDALNCDIRDIAQFESETNDMHLEIVNDLMLEIMSNGKKYENSINSLEKKRTGSYYTSIELTTIMMDELINNMEESYKKTLFDKTFLEPCVGTGNFVFAYLSSCCKLGFTKEQYKKLIDNIYVCDINQSALNQYILNLRMFVKRVFSVSLDEEYFCNHVKGGLLFDLSSDEISYIPLNKVFGDNISKSGFDIIATNPPYKNLKAERKQYPNSAEYEKDRKKYETISRLSENYFEYNNKGILNIYKLFTEEIIRRYCSDKGFCSLLIPSSILSDKTCSELRKFMIENNKIISVRRISETSNYVDASQAVCSILIKKNEKTDNVYVNGSFNKRCDGDISINISDILSDNIDLSFIILDKKGYEKRKQLLHFPKVKSLSFIHNLRGELDITLNKDYIIKNPTPFKFLRGRDIGFYSLIEGNDNEYVDETFIKESAKRNYVFHERLACQQIANMGKTKRLSFTLIPSNNVLGNSCNFISLDENKYNIDLFFLLGVLNSDVIEWYFKLTSSNNHVNNYEIDNFPIPIECSNKETISNLVKEYIQYGNPDILHSINNEINIAYGLGKE